MPHGQSSTLTQNTDRACKAGANTGYTRAVKGQHLNDAVLILPQIVSLTTS